MKRRTLQLTPPQTLALGFLCLIIVGGIVLKMPISVEKNISWIDAFFTAVSATTVTGLTVVDTQSTFTFFGEIIILLLIQIGGVGFMSMAMLIVMMLGKRIGLRQRLLVQEALNQTSIGGVIRLVKRVLVVTLLIELLGIIILSVRWIPEMGVKTGIYYSIFHVIAAYNNAGFALWQDNLMSFVGDPIVNIVISILIIVGGIGFTVLMDLIYSKSFRKLSLHSKIMLVGTGSLTTASFFLFYYLEHTNLRTIGMLSTEDKISASFFQAVTTRTAGFNTVDIGSLNEATLFVMMIMMFIGAGSVSTGGGIKVTTFIVILLAVLSFFRRNEFVMVFKRTIKTSTINRAFAIALAGQFLIFFAVFILMITEKASFIEILFEVVSAFGTVGLSMGITSGLTAFGKLVIMVIMFTGLIGPLTLIFTLSNPKQKKIRYPNGDIFTG